MLAGFLTGDQYDDDTGILRYPYVVRSFNTMDRIQLSKNDPNNN
jgi:hypothetical protein